MAPAESDLPSPGCPPVDAEISFVELATLHVGVVEVNVGETRDNFRRAPAALRHHSTGITDGPIVRPRFPGNHPTRSDVIAGEFRIAFRWGVHPRTIIFSQDRE